MQIRFVANAILKMSTIVETKVQSNKMIMAEMIEVNQNKLIKSKNEKD
jgi:hypothetical protein